MFPSVFLEMYEVMFEKTAAKHLAIGAGIGGAAGAIGSGFREMRLRANEEGTKTPGKLQEVRKSRRKYHIGNTLMGAAAGAGLAHGAKKGYNFLKGEAKAAKDEVYNGAKQTASHVANEARTTADHVTKNVRETADHVSNTVKKTTDDLEGKIKRTTDDVAGKASRVSEEVADNLKSVNQGAAWRAFKRPHDKK